MNQNLLDRDIQSYINANLNADLHSLLLKKSPFSEVKMSEIVQQIKGKKVAEKKFPFLQKENILFPKSLSLEQASSTETAFYKSHLVKGKTMIDLTAGFGIDAFYLSENFQEICLVERQKYLLDIVRYNWGILGKKAQFFNQELNDFLAINKQSFDLVYLDPARRNENQRKVFLLKDLAPNILEIQDELLNIGKQVMIKLSPLIDISYLVTHLKSLKEIHIIAVKNEVKELLVVLEQNNQEKIDVIAVNLVTEEPVFTFDFNEEKKEVVYSEPLKFLYIPNNSILKSGNFNGIAHTFNLKKLDTNTHLYTSEMKNEKFPGRVLEIEKINTKAIKKGEYYNIISKNYPLSPAQIKKKYALKDGGTQYLIFTQSKQRKIILKSCDKS